MSAPRQRPRSSLFGKQTLYLVGVYAQRAVIFMGIALAIVLSLDVATNLSVVTTATGGTLEPITRLGYYVLLRAAYVLPSLLPIAAIVGVLWGEYGLVVSRERQMLSATGQTPLASLGPVMLFGLLVGLLQLGALSAVRPWAVEGQGVSQLRYYGAKFNGPSVTGMRWMNAAGTIVRARVVLGSEVGLQDIELFEFDRAGKVASVTVAANASFDWAARQWTLYDGASWDVSMRATAPSRLGAGPFARRPTSLALDPVWLENADISPALLDQPTLVGLATATAGVPDAARYQAALSERYAGIAYCLAMAVLGGVLSFLRFTRDMAVGRLLGVAGYGGVAYVGINVFNMLATAGNLPPVYGAWVIPLALIAGSPLALVLADRRSTLPAAA